MKNKDKIQIFDKDFLWLFNKLEQTAVCVAADQSIVAITPAAASLFTVSGKKVLGEVVSSLFTPFGLKINFSEVSRNSVLLEVVDKKAANSHKSQKIQKLHWKIKPRTISDGNKVVGYVIFSEDRTDIEYLAQVYNMVTGQDVVDQTSVADYAVDIKNYLESIIASMPGNIYWMDRNCVYLGCNDNAAKFCGLSSRKEAVGLTYQEMSVKAGWTANHIDSWEKDDLEVISTGKPKLNVEEKPVLMPDGNEIFYLTNRVPLFDKNKNVIGVLGISIDITDRKLMERELQKARDRAEKAEKELLAQLNLEITGGSIVGEKNTPVDYVRNIQNYLESIIASMPGNIFWMDRDLVVLGCNDNVAKFAGFSSRKEIVGLTYDDLEKKAGWAAGHTDSWRRDDLEVIATGKPKLNIEEDPVVMPDGKAIYYLTSRVPLFDDRHNVIGVAGVSIDITDRKKAERLENEMDVAERASEFMRMLAGSIAHEIRTPLAIIGINSDLLKLRVDPLLSDEENKRVVDDCFKNIKYAVDLGSHIVRDILTMLKTISSGELVEKKFKYLSIAKDVKQVLDIYPFLEHERDLVKLDLDEVGDFVYYGDNTLTQHVLFNLIKNALYAIKEAEKGKITIRFETNKKYNLLKFRDTALGISKEVIPKVFEQFKTGRPGGAGLGLAFCKVVMDAYGGDIACDSKKGLYTEFVLKFPKVSRQLA